MPLPLSFSHPSVPGSCSRAPSSRRDTSPRCAAHLRGISPPLPVFLLIVIPALSYTAATPFPGLAALPPCLGAALIIAGGEYGTSLVGRLLSLRPVVFLGLISYSLYLWHWPVLAFQNIAAMVSNLPEYDRRLKLLLLVISLVLGTPLLALRRDTLPHRTPPPRAPPALPDQTLRVSSPSQPLPSPS